MLTLVLNPGSTSTKVAIYEDKNELCRKTISHSKEELAVFPDIMDQFEFRYKLVLEFMEAEGYTIDRLDCVISRGGSPPNVNSGATVVDENLVTALKERPKDRHPAGIGPVIAYDISQKCGIPAYIYDPVSADELNPLARLFGVKGIEHDSMCHVLNTRAMSIAQAKEMGKTLEEVNFVVAHFGGGNSVALWEHGKLSDVIAGDAGTFSSERCGPIRSERLLELSSQYDAKTIRGWFHGKGGMVSLLGTNDLREVEKMIVAGDEYALLCQQAMAYQLSRCIAYLFPPVKGAVDGIILTGGGAFWERLVNDIKERLAYLNVPVFVRPGENEMQSLAEGAYRLMTGEEKAQIYEG
ncbi:MAG: butyrate kinase [Lachnospiraceae bacterium]|nr:butyrate kinase [Lachnospiraceae bacterium]